MPKNLEAEIQAILGNYSELVDFDKYNIASAHSMMRLKLIEARANSTAVKTATPTKSTGRVERFPVINSPLTASTT